MRSLIYHDAVAALADQALDWGFRGLPTEWWGACPRMTFYLTGVRSAVERLAAAFKSDEMGNGCAPGVVEECEPALSESER